MNGGSFVLSFSLLLGFVYSMPTATEENEMTYDLENPDTKTQIENLGRSFHVTVDRYNITIETARLVFKMSSYCSCACCQEELSADSCDRSNPVQLPENFTCPPSYCEKNAHHLCKAWDVAKCNKACFCQRCSGLLSSDDYRCQQNQSRAVSPGPMCKCSRTSKDDCAPEPENLPKIWLELALVKADPERIKCMFGCYCTKCNLHEINHLVPTVHTICSNYTTVPLNDCKCGPCPTVQDAQTAKQNVHALSISHGSSGS